MFCFVRDRNVVDLDRAGWRVCERTKKHFLWLPEQEFWLQSDANTLYRLYLHLAEIRSERERESVSEPDLRIRSIWPDHKNPHVKFIRGHRGAIHHGARQQRKDLQGKFSTVIRSSLSRSSARLGKLSGVIFVSRSVDGPGRHYEKLKELLKTFIQ